MYKPIDAPRIRIALAAAGLNLGPPDPLPEVLLELADRLKLPRHALLAWIGDRPPHPFTERHFFTWLLRYKLTSAAALASITNATNDPSIETTRPTAPPPAS